MSEERAGGFGRRVLFGAAAALAIGTGTAVAGSRTAGKGRPVTITAMASSSGWLLQFHAPENGRVVSYRLPDDDAFEPVAQAWATVSFDRLRKTTPIAVRWVDEIGAAQTVVVDFDPRAQAVASVRSILAMVTEWIAFRPANDARWESESVQEVLLYFTTLIVYKYAIREIRWSVDGGALDRTVRFEPSDRPGIGSDDELFVRLPRRPKLVALEVVFVDGSTSGVKRFAPPRTGESTGATLLGNRAD